LYIEEIGEGIDNVLDIGNSYLGVKFPGFWGTSNKYFNINKTTKEWLPIATKVNLCNVLGKLHSNCNKEKIKLSSFSFLSIPVFVDDKNAYAVVRLVYPGYAKPIKEKYLTITSEDGGLSWVYDPRPIPGETCLDTSRGNNGEIIAYCNGRSADFYQSVDMGKTWQHVRQSIKF